MDGPIERKDCKGFTLVLQQRRWLLSRSGKKEVQKIEPSEEKHLFHT
jgi:hypothetical protein